MRIGIQIDEKVYDFYTEIETIKIKHPFYVVEGTILIFDTETNEWSWVDPKDEAVKDTNLIYMAPQKTAEFIGKDATEEGEHIILAAFDVYAPSREEAHNRLLKVLPHPSDVPGFVLDSWWVAEDDRTDRSDLDSAVFCKPGMQREATQALRNANLAN